MCKSTRIRVNLPAPLVIIKLTQKRVARGGRHGVFRFIRQLCKERGIAINKLATMSGINQSTIDNIVRGLTKNPRVMTLHKIAIAFNMTVAEFLDFKELNDYSFDDQNED